MIFLLAVLICWPTNFKLISTFLNFFFPPTHKNSFDNGVKFLVTNVETGVPPRPALLLSLSLQCLRLDTATSSLTTACLGARISTMTNHSTHWTQNIKF